ncbi:hypothetical protein Dimus_006051 [Dionaea muscipula]
MKRRQSRRTHSADLLVCFSPRAHLTLMPKPICSPARHADPNGGRRRSTGIHPPPPPPPPPHLKKCNTRRASGGGGGVKGSPEFWTQTKQLGGVPGQELSEPSSPKVTCAGQIKVRHRSSSCRNWHSVMHEIERIRNERKLQLKKKKEKTGWAESLGFKKDVTQFLTCLRSIRFDFRCFGSFPGTVISSEDEEDEEEGEEDEDDGNQFGIKENEAIEDSGEVFSKWLMVLNENQKHEETGTLNGHGDDDGSNKEACMVQPPPNALLLMRCRSAPAKSWIEERRRAKENEDYKKLDLEVETRKGEENGKQLEEEEEMEKKRESLAILMRYEGNFEKLSSDIAKETWVVGGFKDPLSRSRSCKR